jgi:hypothetical protein
MTNRRDLKKLVRARQARTGERYTTALEHVLARRPAISVLELIDLTEEGKALGLRGQMGIFSDLAERVDGRAALERLRAILHATADDPATSQLRSVLLDGQPPAAPSRGVYQRLEEGRRFLARARAGLGGVSESGKMIAFGVGGEIAVGLLWGPPPLPGVSGHSALVLRSPEILLPESTETAVMLLGAGWPNVGRAPRGTSTAGGGA